MITGLVMCLGAIWLGFYCIYESPREWWTFPTIASFIALFSAGVFIVVVPYE